jgi:flavin reductase (DIM6/NTAB) family NADH-FMN oxidoreductase RutF
MNTDHEQPVDSATFRRALGTFATGVAVVTASSGVGGAAGITINSFASLSLDPPLVLWSLNARSSSLGVFRSAPFFAINILSEQQSPLSARFAAPRSDKFDGVDWEAGLGGAPLIAGCAARFECRTVSQIEGGDHLLFIGRVARLWQDDRDALMFYRGRYLRHAETARA